MQSSPLQLNNYFFPHVEVVANPEWVQDSTKGLPLVNCSVNMTRPESNETYLVQLDISINSTPENPSQYLIKLIAIGFFSVPIDIPNKDQFVEVSGASILYSAAREYLLQLMSRGPWIPLILNPMSFAPAPVEMSSNKN